MNHPSSDPHFHLSGMVESKFDSKDMKRNENDVFKRRMKSDQNIESSIKIQTRLWYDRQPSSEKVPCDSTSSPSIRNNFAVPLDPQEYRQIHKLKTPEKIISSITPAEYLKLSRTGSLSDRSLSTATSLKSGFLDMPGSRNSGRHSARGKKRMLSVSPICSEMIDLHEIIRTSPNSLVAFVNNNDFRSGFISRSSTGRNSSAASHVSHSSYGHLSPAPVSQPVVHRQRNHFATPDTFIQNLRKISNPPPTSVRDVSSFTGDLLPHTYQEFNNNVGEKLEVDSNQTEVHSSSVEKTKLDVQAGGDSGDDEEEGESKEDFRCQWKGCGILCENQGKLVEHVNEHIQNNKKDCTCYWDTCSRDEKPFKAMYMLVVHVRRHTGEKPHKCHYEGCNKAYSRLENLKTHLRSHTGERPYVCEVPGCTKAFSNASDRAKHQNRTHSSVKQYGCKVEGCPKRYTDPSSLRKHMKTVHGAISQPNKKIKVDHKPIKKEQSVKIKVEEAEDPPSPNNRQPIEECKPVKHSPNNYSDHQDSSGNGWSPSYNHSFRISYNNSSYEASAGSYGRQQQVNSNAIVSSTSHDIQRRWNKQGDMPSNFVHNDPLNLLNEFIDDSNQGNGADLHVQIAPRNVLPNLHKPIDPSFSSRRLSNDSIKKLGQRRESDVSTGSADSNYMSGTETYNGSRRDSSHSTLSYLSGGRHSASLPSPLPSRNLSPGRINTTVIEGEVLDNYHDSNPARMKQPNPQLENALRDVTNVENNNNMNAFSRVSSGYGSQQTTYFPAKTPTSSSSPTPSREQRRASEGCAIRVSDAGFNLTEINKKQLSSRRASDPVKIRSVIEAEPPRRGSFSYYSVLPTPKAMQSISDNQIFSKQQHQQQQLLPQPQPPPQSQQRFAGGNLMVMSQNVNTFHQQQSPHHLSPQRQQMAADMSPIVYAQPDSTNTIADNDDISMLVDNFSMGDQMEMSPQMSMMQQQQQQQMLSQQHAMLITNSHAMINAPRLSHIQPSQQISSSNFMGNNFTSQSSNMDPRPPSTPRNAPQQTNNIQGNYDFTLQWTSNHFGAAKQQVQQMEPDSTVDNDFENLMVNGMASLNTAPEERPKTNMAINRMDSLLTSYAEENKYFEFNSSNRYQ